MTCKSLLKIRSLTAFEALHSKIIYSRIYIHTLKCQCQYVRKIIRNTIKNIGDCLILQVECVTSKRNLKLQYKLH